MRSLVFPSFPARDREGYFRESASSCDRAIGLGGLNAKAFTTNALICRVILGFPVDANDAVSHFKKCALFFLLREL